VIDGHETILFEAVFTPFGVISGPTNDVRPLASGLSSLMDILDGRHLALSDAMRVCEQITAMAKHCHVDPLALAGENLFEEFYSYFRVQHADYEDLFHDEERVILATLCERIGQPSDEQTGQNAKQRALALLRVLQAIARGFVDPRAKLASLVSDPSDYEEHSSDEDKKG
jgi:hypothetical protein